MRRYPKSDSWDVCIVCGVHYKKNRPEQICCGAMCAARRLAEQKKKRQYEKKVKKDDL